MKFVFPVTFPITFLSQGIRAWWTRTQLHLYISNDARGARIWLRSVRIAAKMLMSPESEAMSSSRSCKDPRAAWIWSYVGFLELQRYRIWAAFGLSSRKDACAAWIWSYVQFLELQICTCSQNLKLYYILVALNAFLLCFLLHFPLHFQLQFILDHTMRIRRSVLSRYLGGIDPRFQISRDLSVESGPEVSEVGPGTV